MENKLGPYLLGPNDENQGIYTGDARELAPAIPDESVDLIFTDPVYQNIDDYRWLAETAARVLKPGGNLLAQASDPDYRFMAECMMREVMGLVAQPTIAEIFNVSTWRFFKHKVFVSWKPYLWFSKGARSGEWVHTRYNGGGRSKATHEWGDSTPFFYEYTSRLTELHQVIFDPFTGGATVPAACKMLGRRWLAFEIDPATADKARERVRMTQPPLFVPQPEQMELQIEQAGA